MPEPSPPFGRTLKLTLSYDGTPFVGWQRQAEGVSIQGLLEEALSRLEGAPVAVIGAGRTDAGVHACGQVASAQLSKAHDVDTLRRAINAMLPPEVRVLLVEEVPSTFHARYSARAKTYRYLLTTSPVVSPFDSRYCWQVRQRLDTGAMTRAALFFEGEHDFAAFRGSGSSVTTSRRRVHTSRIVQPDASGCRPWGAWRHDREDAPGALIYEVTATGFLRHMVRAMVGTLVEIGAGRREPSCIDRALGSGERADAGPTAPACGLCLVHVDYAAGS